MTEEKLNLPADAFETHVAGQLPVADRAHHAGQVIRQPESHQSQQQAVTAAQVIPQPAAHRGKYHLDHVPKFFHCSIPHFLA